MYSADYMKLTLRAVATSKMRSLLTILGIGIGIAAVVMLTSLGEGLRFYVLDNFSQFGSRILAINPGKTQTGGMGGLMSSTQPLTLEDSNSMKSLPHVEYVVPLVQGAGAIEYKQRVRNTDILAVGSDMHLAWRFPLIMGRSLPSEEAGYSQPYAVLGYKVWQELFAGASPLGEFIRVGGERYRVVGVLEEKGQMLGFDLDDIVYIPIDRGLALFNRVGLMEVDVVYLPTASSDQIASIIRQHLILRHGAEDFNLITQDQMLVSLDRILGILSMAIAGLGGISLLVGAIGIVTIMLTTVRERRAEIGLFRALGATSRQILLLFLGEAILLAILGAIAGICLAGVLLMLLFFFVPELPISLHPLYLLLALGLSVVVGLAAGVLPARHASQMSPVHALQAE